MSNFLFVPGPCKTGTTTLYSIFKSSKEINLIGGKECYKYKKNNFKLPHNNKLNVMFDHNALFNPKDLEKLDQLGAYFIIILRHPVKQAISRVLHDLRVGVIKYEDLIKFEDINDIEDRYYERGNYLKIIKSMTKSQRKRILFINIEDLSQPEVIEKKLFEIFSIKVSLKSNISKNTAKLSKAPGLIYLLRTYIRPIFIFFNADKLWTYLKSSRASNILYDNQNIDNIKEDIKKRINIELLNERYLNFKKTLRYD